MRCIVCSTELEICNTGRVPKYCSDACRKNAYKKRQRATKGDETLSDETPRDESVETKVSTPDTIAPTTMDMVIELYAVEDFIAAAKKLMQLEVPDRIKFLERLTPVEATWFFESHLKQVQKETRVAS